MVLLVGFTAERLGVDLIARELAYFCVINPDKYFEECDKLVGAERRKCKNRVSFALYCAKKTKLVEEISDSTLLILVPCVLTLKRIYREEIDIKKRISELLMESGEPVKLRTNDIRMVIRQAEKLLPYPLISEYAEKVASSCHLSKEALRLIKISVSGPECEAISTLLLSYVIVALNAMTLKKALQAYDDLVYEFARTCSLSLHTSHNSQQPYVGIMNISDVLHELVNSLLEVYFLSNHVPILLHRHMYSKYLDTTPSRQRFAKYMATKLLRYNACMRISTEMKKSLSTTVVDKNKWQSSC